MRPNTMKDYFEKLSTSPREATVQRLLVWVGVPAGRTPEERLEGTWILHPAAIWHCLGPSRCRYLTGKE